MGESQAAQYSLYLNRQIKKKNSSVAKVRRRILFLVWIFRFIYISLINEIQLVSSVSVPVPSGPRTSNRYPPTGMWKIIQTLENAENSSSEVSSLNLNEHKLEGVLTGLNCTSPVILNFPPDLFTQAERRDGAVLIHFVASLYVFYAIALICNDYFVPSVEIICEELHIPSDVAGATFMAIATSSPELFTNVIGTFVTHSDMGVNTIVGSAMFNLFALCACCGFAAKSVLSLDWYPLTRDCIFYGVSVILLIIVSIDCKVFWYEALSLIVAYIVYLIVMCKNAATKAISVKFAHEIKKIFESYSNNSDEDSPLIGAKNKQKIEAKFDMNGDDNLLIANALQRCEEEAEMEENNFGVFRFPLGASFFVWIEWFLSWPARFIFAITIPDCRKMKFRKTYPITFVMCILYIAMFSYVVSWLMTIVGHTFRIPDSVMGSTFIAAGTSIPETVSSIIVARQGLGSMDISNSIGSNTFDILICLGLPWLIRCAMVADTSENYIKINSGGLEYSAIILIVSLVLLYALLAYNKFYLDKKVASIALFIYGLYLVYAVLFEMNVFFMVNLPTCDIHTEL